MRRRNKLVKVYHIIMYLMIAIFISAPISQAFHSHDTIVSMGSEDQKRLTSHEVHCELCDHFSHQQANTLLPLESLSILFFGNVPEIPLAHYAWGLISLPGLSWTNKGPPASAA